MTANRMSVFINGSRIIQSPAGLPSLNPSSESCLQVCPPHDLNQPLQVASLKCWRTAKNTQSTHTRETEVCTWTMVTCTDWRKRNSVLRSCDALLTRTEHRVESFWDRKSAGHSHFPLEVQSHSILWDESFLFVKISFLFVCLIYIVQL